MHTSRYTSIHTDRELHLSIDQEWSVSVVENRRAMGTIVFLVNYERLEAQGPGSVRGGGMEKDREVRIKIENPV